MLIFVNHDDLRGQEVMEELVKNGKICVIVK